MKLEQIITVSSIVMLNKEDHGVYAPKWHFWKISKAGFDLTLIRDLARDRPQWDVNERFILRIADEFDAEFLFSSLVGRRFQFANRRGDASLVRTTGELSSRSMVALKIILPNGGNVVFQS